jgi:hypothetical protein
MLEENYWILKKTLKKWVLCKRQYINKIKDNRENYKFEGIPINTIHI